MYTEHNMQNGVRVHGTSLSYFHSNH